MPNEQLPPVVEGYKKMSYGLNSGSRNVEPFYQALTQDHRTLQQSFWRLVFRCIRKYANADFDGRNELAVRTCRKIDELMSAENNYWDELPLI